MKKKCPKCNQGAKYVVSITDTVEDYIENDNMKLKSIKNIETDVYYCECGNICYDTSPEDRKDISEATIKECKDDILKAAKRKGYIK